ncbi:hypothetical protein PIIN_00143 [Serendipita indica DSM 11827]|uniref:Uncharacterized protein n=1 Tax=Serendipita indica (strain DSM 11827) TaxID=1109443 RepID=G4T595_SERID|nr:hypothetical protein PIIN_00143 [Serendipita indica DSM 11827]
MASSSTLQLSSTLASGTSVTRVNPTDSLTSSNPPSSTSGSDSGYGGSPFAPSSGQNGPDGLPGGPNIYLYGFLATLVLIFLVSIAVAWKGYRTRRLLRARIEEAIARGVYIPGYGDPVERQRQRRPVGPKPIMWEEWIEKDSHTDVPREKTVWDIKPTAVSVSHSIMTPASPGSQPSTSPARVTGMQRYRQNIRRMFAPVGEYWFGYPHDSASDIQRPEPAVVDSELKNGVPTNTEELLKDAEDVNVSVMILMPSSDKRIYHGSWRQAGDKGKSVSRSSSQSGQHPEEEHGQINPEIIETAAASHGTDRHDQEAEQLPELVLGVAAVALRPPTSILSAGKEMEGSASRPSAAIEFPAPTQ